MISINRIALRDAWARYACSGTRPWYRNAGEMEREAFRGFDTWLADIRAAAWEEGWDAAAYDLESVEHGIVPPSNLSTNPYRKETEE